MPRLLYKLKKSISAKINIGFLEISQCIEKVLCYIFAIALFISIIRQINFIVVFFKRMILSLSDEKMLVQIKYIIDKKVIYACYICIIASVIGIILEKCIVYIVCYVKDKRNMRFLTKDKFSEALYTFLENKNESSCLVVEGDWGAGKTYSIKKFFDEYMKYKRIPFYIISCFGLSDRSQIIETIKNECKIQDRSIGAKLLENIQYVPLIGEALYKILEKNYDFATLNKKTIFVFEDFERISCEEDSDKEKKYNIFAGFINDIYEKYRFRIIIVCNKKEIGLQTFNKLLWDKLKCNIVTISNQYSEAYSIAKKIVEQKNSLSKDHKYLLMLLIEREITNLIKIFEKSEIQNIRVLERAFDDICEKVVLTEDLQDNMYENRCIIYKCLFCFILSHTKREISMQDNKTYFESYINTYNKNSPDKLLELFLIAPTDLIWLDSVKLVDENKQKAIQFDKLIKDENILSDEAGADTLILAVAYIISHKDGENNKIINEYLEKLKEIIFGKAINDVTVEFINKIYEYLGQERFNVIYTPLKEFLVMLKNNESERLEDGGLEYERYISRNIIREMDDFIDYKTSNYL